MRWVLRLLVAASTFLLGAAVALCTVALHGYWWGLALGLVATAATLVALPGGWARLPFALGWAALVVYATQRRPEGDYVIAEDAQGWVLLGAMVVVLVCGMIGARHRGPTVAPPSDGARDSR